MKCIPAVHIQTNKVKWLPLEEVLWTYIHNKQLFYMTYHGEYKLIETIEESERLMVGGDFFQKADRSCLVNMSKITGFNKKSRTLCFNEGNQLLSCPVSRSNAYKFKLLYDHTIQGS